MLLSYTLIHSSKPLSHAIFHHFNSFTFRTSYTIYYPSIYHTLFTTLPSSILTTWPYNLNTLSSFLSSRHFSTPQISYYLVPYLDYSLYLKNVSKNLFLPLSLKIHHTHTPSLYTLKLARALAAPTPYLKHLSIHISTFLTLRVHLLYLQIFFLMPHDFSPLSDNHHSCLQSNF